VNTYSAIAWNISRPMGIVGRVAMRRQFGKVVEME